jgi:hypothetical protein
VAGIAVTIISRLSLKGANGISDLTAVLNLIVTAFSVIIAGIGAIIAFRTYQTNYRQSIKQKAFDTISSVVSGEFAQFRKKLSDLKVFPHKDGRTYIEDSEKFRDEDGYPSKAYIVRDILNIIELLCCGIQEEVLDKNIAFKQLNTIVFQYWRWSKPFILLSRLLVDKQLEKISKEIATLKTKSLSVDSQIDLEKLKKLLINSLELFAQSHNNNKSRKDIIENINKIKEKINDKKIIDLIELLNKIKEDGHPVYEAFEKQVFIWQNRSKDFSDNDFEEWRNDWRECNLLDWAEKQYEVWMGNEAKKIERNMHWHQFH